MNDIAFINVKDYGKVAVLMGGNSAERAISIESGNAVHTALSESGVNSHLFDYNKETLSQLRKEKFDRVFIALHGRGGEDGTIQGALESIGLPYTGSGVLGSALAMDKIRSKVIWREYDLPAPAAIELHADSDWRKAVEQLGLPVMVKPVNEGSSIGASKVSKEADLQAAWLMASKFDKRVMAESWVNGAEYTVSILNDRVLPLIKLETKRDFYDYQAKYEDNNTQYICPCDLDEKTETALGELALKACQLLDVSGWSRVDVFLENSGEARLIEVNTIPGMTSHSLVPMAAKKAGLSFQQLVLAILSTSLTKFTKGIMPA